MWPCVCDQYGQVYLNEEQGLQQQVKQHISDALTYAGERLCFTSRHLKGQISNVLQHRRDPSKLLPTSRWDTHNSLCVTFKHLNMFHI